MSNVSPYNYKTPVLEGNTNTTSGTFFRWLNELTTAVMSALRTDTQGVYTIPNITATTGSALTAADGMLIYVTDTNGTFTSIGFWGYENGAWVKL